MELTTAHYIQLTAALFLGIALFVAVQRLPEKATIAFLLITIPIHFVDSRFGTSNTIVTFLVAFAFLIQQRIRFAPLMLPVLILLMAYALSLSMSHPAARVQHLFYIIGFVSNIILFYLVYNFVVRTGEWKYVLRVFVALNFVVITACALEITLGQSQFRLFGLEEWGITASRAQAGRLVGPFGSTHTTSDYIVTQSMLLAFFLIFSENKFQKYIAISLLAAGCMAVVATGDRGGFVGLIVGAFAFVFLFYRTIGIARSIKLSIAGIVLFVAGSLVMINYTSFGVLYERLERTTVQSGLDDARGRGFRNGLSYFEESPILGLGPKLAVSKKGRLVADIPYRPYPHILVMFILGTLGIVGLVSWLLFFTAVISRLLLVLKRRCPDDMLAHLPRVGILVIALFLAGELRIEFLREDFLDYQNYMFCLFGWLVGCADLIKQQSLGNHPNVRSPTITQLPRSAD